MFQTFRFSQPGGHGVNEDSFLVAAHPDEPGCCLCAVADGQGGRAGGAEASRVACRAVVDGAARLPPKKLLRPAAWRSLLAAADQAVAAARGAGFTTLVGLAVHAGAVVGAANGDSAAVVRCGSGEPDVVTDGQRKNPPVGSGAAAVTPFSAQLTGPWLVLLLTDGVWKYAGWPGVLEAARALRGAELVDALVEKTRVLPGGQLWDDTTIVVVEGPVAAPPAPP